ncbi:Partitioning defective 3-like protein B [Camelus dromedarius]|uniref:Partitioning defective 3-like protein B n=1 Tax=Camelus dromedarius TaxID=9838 RepID=A0A5N4E5P3_CAMDR|nr:Partitioning defective 3-like protein B [Camelus dromedarius]
MVFGSICLEELLLFSDSYVILGLFIRGIEENSRSKREGLFHENECIVKINNVDLVDKTFAQAQDVFRQAMKSPRVLLHVLPPQNREQYEKSVIGPLNIFGNNDVVLRTKVNGRDVTGRTQEELVAMLRSTKQGETASLVIARQEGTFLPRELVCSDHSLTDFPVRNFIYSVTSE